MAFYAMSKDFAVFKWFRAISEWGMLTISGENGTKKMVHIAIPETIYVLLYLQTLLTFDPPSQFQ